MIEVVGGLTLADGKPVANTRIRVVWTNDEKRLLTRLAKVFNAHGDKLQLRCGNDTCPDNRMILYQDDSAPGGRILRCGCTDRLFSPVH